MMIFPLVQTIDGVASIAGYQFGLATIAVKSCNNRDVIIRNNIKTVYIAIVVPAFQDTVTLRK